MTTSSAISTMEDLIALWDSPYSMGQEETELWRKCNILARREIMWRFEIHVSVANDIPRGHDRRIEYVKALLVELINDHNRRHPSPNLDGDSSSSSSGSDCSRRPRGRQPARAAGSSPLSPISITPPAICQCSTSAISTMKDLIALWDSPYSMEREEAVLWWNCNILARREIMWKFEIRVSSATDIPRGPDQLIEYVKALLVELINDHNRRCPTPNSDRDSSSSIGYSSRRPRGRQPARVSGSPDLIFEMDM